MKANPRVTVWNEGVHEKTHPEVAKTYPQGIHGAIGEYLSAQGLAVRAATLEQPGAWLDRAGFSRDGRTHLVGSHSAR